MNISSANHLLLYLRYFDDIVAVFGTSQSSLKFLDILNSQDKT